MIAQAVIFSLAYLGKGGKVDMWYNPIFDSLKRQKPP